MNEPNTDSITWDIVSKQGDRTVEYKAEFVRLSKYACTLVADEISQAKRLEKWLK